MSIQLSKVVSSLSFKEISDGNRFEDLVEAYFNDLIESDKNVLKGKVWKSGVGQDDGKDILVEMEFEDNIGYHTRLWVVQCKFRDHNISPKEIESINIPSLIHSNNACGYLLICKKNATSGTTNLFAKLNSNCKFGYDYQIWTGSAFLQKLTTKAKVISQFFPKYYGFVETNLQNNQRK